MIYDNLQEYQVQHNFTLNIEVFEERTHKAASNNQELYALVYNIEAKLIHYRQALTSILVSKQVTMVHNNFKGILVVMGLSNDYHNINVDPNQVIKLKQDSLGQINNYQKY